MAPTHTFGFRTNQVGIASAVVIVLLATSGACAGGASNWFYGAWECKGERTDRPERTEINMTAEVDGNDSVTNGTYILKYSWGEFDGTWQRSSGKIELSPADLDHFPTLTIEHSGDIPATIDREIDVSGDHQQGPWSAEIKSHDEGEIALEIFDERGSALTYECRQNN